MKEYARKDLMMGDRQSLDGIPIDFSCQQLEKIQDINSKNPKHIEKPLDYYTIVPEKKHDHKFQDYNQNDDPVYESQIYQTYTWKGTEPKKDAQPRFKEKKPIVQRQPCLKEQQKQIESERNKPVEEPKDKGKIQIKTVSSILLLNNNLLTSLNGFKEAIQSKVPSLELLGVINLSFNKLTSIDYGFSHFPNLKTLYLNDNMIQNIDSVYILKGCKISDLRLQANPCCKDKDYKLKILKTVPYLKRLDKMIFSVQERDEISSWIKYDKTITDSTERQLIISLIKNQQELQE